MKTDLNTSLKDDTQYWSIEWTFLDSKKEKVFVEITHQGHTGGVLGVTCLKNGIFDGNAHEKRPKYAFKG